MNETYRNIIANFGATLLKVMTLVDAAGNEIAGGSPAFTRKALIWDNASDGTIKLTSDITFNIPANTTVAGWVIYDNLGVIMATGSVTQEHFNGQGEYKIVAATSSISHVQAIGGGV